MNRPPIKFAVIIPIHNRPEYLYSSVHSVFRQTYCTEQVIVVDDFSDNQCQKEFAVIISVFQELLPISYLRLDSNMGPACARNRALEILNPYVTHISFLDSDDVWHPCKLQAVASIYARLDCDIVLHKYTNSRKAFHFRLPPGLSDSCNSVRKIGSLDALLSNPCQTSCLSMARSSMLPFPSGQRYCEDYCLILSALALGRTVYQADYPLTLLGREQHSAGGLSFHILRMRIGEIKSYWQYACHAGNLYCFPILVLLSLFKASLLFIRLSIKRASSCLSG